MITRQTARNAAVLFCVSLYFVVLVPPVLAGDVAQGRQKARQCQVCHGYDGIGKNPEVPHIAGKNSVYLTKQLKAFRSGAGRHAQMSIIAKGLSDEDISNHAAYCASIKISVEVPTY